MKKGLKIIGLAAGLALLGLFIVFRFFMEMRIPDEKVAARFAHAGLPAPVFQRFEGSNGGVQYVVSGAGNQALVIWIHGSPGGWDAFLSYLADPALSGRYVQAALDRYGYGGSHPEASSSLERHAAAVGELIRELPAGLPVIVAGHSFGGPVALRAAMDFPDRIDGVLILAGFTDPALGRRPWLFRLFRHKPLRYLVPHDLNQSNDEITPIGRELAAIADSWPQLKQPTAWIHGEKDMLVPVAHLDYALANLPCPPVYLRRLPKENHFIPWTQKALVLEALDELARAAAEFHQNSPR